MLLSDAAAMKAIAQDELLTLESALYPSISGCTHENLPTNQGMHEKVKFPALMPVLLGFPC